MKEKTIWKFDVPIKDSFTINMPLGAKILAFQMQKGFPYIWAIVEPEKPKVVYRFTIFGTGNPIEGTLSEYEYIGTVQTEMGLVWHLFKNLL